MREVALEEENNVQKHIFASPFRLLLPVEILPRLSPNIWKKPIVTCVGVLSHLFGACSQNVLGQRQNYIKTALYPFILMY